MGCLPLYIYIYQTSTILFFHFIFLWTENSTQTVIHRRLQVNLFEISQVLKRLWALFISGLGNKVRLAKNYIKAVFWSSQKGEHWSFQWKHYLVSSRSKFWVKLGRFFDPWSQVRWPLRCEIIRCFFQVINCICSERKVPICIFFLLCLQHKIIKKILRRI